MHKLHRNNVAAPICLANYHHPAHTWDDLGPPDKNEIRMRLEEMQAWRCAYCEGPLDSLGHHIEHFRRKAQGHFPHLTFVWTNLYWSCDQPDSCGHYKDHGAGPYNPNDLIEPCVDDPDEFFRFRTDGTISIRPDLPPAAQRKAHETLRVFNLNPRWGRLRNMRKAAVSTYVALVDKDLDFSENDLREFFSDELSEAERQPFCTAIRHVLTKP